MKNNSRNYAERDVITESDFSPVVLSRLHAYCLFHELTLAQAAKELFSFRRWVDGKLHEWKIKHYNNRWYGMSAADLDAFDRDLTLEVMTAKSGANA